MKKALTHLCQSDPRLKRVIRRVGVYSIEYSPADFSTIVRCIIYQQLSGRVAATLYQRLVRSLEDGHGVTPEAVLRLSSEQMRSLGLSRSKTSYIMDLARGCVAGELDLPALERLPDDEVMRRLTAHKGIGPWTAHMYLIFALRRPDVLPVGDLGIRVAVRKLDGLPTTPSPDEVERRGERWRPYATVASWYLWRSLGDGAGLDPA